MGIEEIIVSIHDAEAKADGILSDAADEARNVQIKAEEEAERIKKESAEKSLQKASLRAISAVTRNTVSCIGLLCHSHR